MDSTVRINIFIYGSFILYFSLWNQVMRNWSVEICLNKKKKKNKHQKMRILVKQKKKKNHPVIMIPYHITLDNWRWWSFNKSSQSRSKPFSNRMDLLLEIKAQIDPLSGLVVDLAYLKNNHQAKISDTQLRRYVHGCGYTNLGLYLTFVNKPQVVPSSTSNINLLLIHFSTRDIYLFCIVHCFLLSNSSNPTW